MQTAKLIWLAFALGCSARIGAQSQHRLEVVVENVAIAVFKTEIATFQPIPIESDLNIYTFLLPDSAAVEPKCRALLQFFREKSYLSAAIDSIVRPDSLHTRAFFHLGPPMQWVSLRAAPTLDSRWLSAAGFREKKFQGKPLNHAVVLKMQEKLLQTAENNGFPFASVGLDSIKITADGAVSAVLGIEKNQFFTLTDLRIKGDLRLPKGYLTNYLGLHRGDPYSRAKILLIRDRLRTLQFLDMTSNPTVTFAGNEATVNLFLQKKRASRFDFIIGLLPQPNTDNGRLLLTGSLNAAFHNALNYGERITAEIERLRPETQRLDVQASVPYLLGLPIGVEGHLNIFKRDSTWLDAQSDFGVQYFLEGGNYFKVFWENKSSSLLTVDTATVRKSRRLPPNLDVRQNGFGIAAVLNRLDYRFNPRKGWALNAKVSAGFSTLRRNSQVEAIQDPAAPNFRYATLYDTVTARAARYRLEGTAEGFVPLFARSTFKISVRGGALISPKRAIYNNEQYRLGGNRLLRGFNEESLFATRFLVGTLEYRLLIGANSFLSVFSDYGYLENVTDRTRVFLHPLGIGAGMNFETKAGVFGISIAVGQQEGQAFDARATKFHLGYVSLF